jgi:hypothetical protein
MIAQWIGINVGKLDWLVGSVGCTTTTWNPFTVQSRWSIRRMPTTSATTRRHAFATACLLLHW